MSQAIFIALMAILAWSDAKFKRIPNVIVLPATFIAACLLSTGLWAMLMFFIGILFYDKKLCQGGDVKLMTMIGAFLGWKAIPVLILSIMAIKLYRRFKVYYAPLPAAPFVLVATLIIVTTDNWRWAFAH